MINTASFVESICCLISIKFFLSSQRKIAHGYMFLFRLWTNNSLLHPLDWSHMSNWHNPRLCGRDLDGSHPYRIHYSSRHRGSKSFHTRTHVDHPAGHAVGSCLSSDNPFTTICGYLCTPALPAGTRFHNDLWSFGHEDE